MANSCSGAHHSQSVAHHRQEQREDARERRIKDCSVANGSASEMQLKCSGSRLPIPCRGAPRRKIRNPWLCHISAAREGLEVTCPRVCVCMQLVGSVDREMIKKIGFEVT